MKCGFDFQSGYFADNLLHCLFHAPEEQFLRLKRTNQLFLAPGEYTPSVRSLKIEYVNNYILASEADPKEVFFSTLEDREPAYTKNDSFVIFCLDHFPPKLLSVLEKWIAVRYPSDLYDSDLIKPGHRLIASLRGWPRGTVSPSAVETLPPWKRGSAELADTLDRFVNRHNWNPNHVFCSNAWPELASFAGVSLHWLFQLSLPLYCKTQRAELLFDRYTLMMESDQESFVDVLTALLEAYIEPFQAELSRIRGERNG